VGVSGQEKSKEKDEKYFAVDPEGFYLFDDPNKPEVYILSTNCIFRPSKNGNGTKSKKWDL
jgi:hypothetical protein